MNSKKTFIDIAQSQIMRTGKADLPLHHGSCPKWLFERMVKLGRSITEVIVLEHGRNEFLRKISDPFWFQALACVLGWDFHSSGATTVVTAVLKEAIEPTKLGIAVLGGKGRVSIRTPEEIESLGDVFGLSTAKVENLKYVSRIVAKVDNNALQDGYTLYHHSILVTEDGRWAVVQQGMNERSEYARRYHWLGEDLRDFVVEPHKAIAGEKQEKTVLNMIAKESEEARKACIDLVKENVHNLRSYFASAGSLVKYLKMKREHAFNKLIYKKIADLHEFQPRNFEELLAFKGIGPKTVRALVLLSKLIWGVEASWKDPKIFSFAHGGKDGVPHSVDVRTYEKSISFLSEAIESAELGKEERLRAFKKLKNFLKVQAIQGAF